VAEEAPGQAAEQPTAALQMPETMNQAEAVNFFEKAFEKIDEATSKPRDESGKFVAKEKPEAPAEEAPKEAAAEEAPAEEAPAEETPAEKRRLKLKYKGEEIEKDEEEVVSLAQQGFDYTQKSQALAKEREEMSQKIQAEVAARQKEYEQRLEVQKRALEKMAGLEDVDLNKLSQEDPVRAQQEFFKRVAFNQQIAQIEAEQQKIVQQRVQEQQAAIRKQAEASVEALQTKIPGWGNDLYGKVLKAAVKDYGFQQQEVNAITDHRAIEVLHDAMQWRLLKAAKPQTVDKRVTTVPKVTKPGTTEKADPKATKLKDGFERLSKSGHRNDAVDYFAELLEQKRL